MFAVKKSGALYYRHTNSTRPKWEGFSRSDRVSGQPRSAPSLTVDNSGRLWMFATKANGDLYYRHTTNGPPAGTASTR